jgi:hypothetical protein
MVHCSLTVTIVSLVLACMMALHGAEHEEHEHEEATPSTISQVGHVITQMTGNAASTATDAASVLLPGILDSTINSPIPDTCNVTAFMIHVDNCVTPDRVAKWIKIAKPFMRLMAKAELPTKKNNKE